MKFIALLLLPLFLLLDIKALAQKISLAEKNASLEKIFHSIERQSGYLFWYEYPVVARIRKIDISVSNATLSDALDSCLKGLPLKYNIVNKTIVVTSKDEDINAPALPMEIEGRVTDSTGTPLEGVSVSLPGYNTGVVTHPDGTFRVALAAGQTMRLSFLSYETIDIKVKEKSFLNIIMKPVHSPLSDVVVIGYGSLAKKNISSAISVINTQGLRNQPLASFDQAIAGQAAGVHVSQLSGMPGGGAIIRVRGTGSISAGNEPLIVIDGFPVEGAYNRNMNPLATIDPMDVESIQILKDASSAAIYGSRGSNGVILVTTKRGTVGKATIQLNSYFGTQQVAHKIDMLNAREYAMYNTEARNNAWEDAGGNSSDPNAVRPDRFKIPPMLQDAESFGKGTDWQEEIFRAVPVQHHHVSLSMGNDQTQYMVSAGYFNQKGIILNTGFERYSFRFNLDSRITRKIKIGMGIAPSYSKNKVLPVDEQIFYGGIIGSALAMPPTIPVYNPDGTFTTLLGTSPYNFGLIDNPVAIATQLQSSSSVFRTLANFFIEWEILSGLRLKTSFGGDLYENRNNSYWPSTLGRNGLPPPVIPEANASTSRTFVWLNENTITFDKVFNKKHLVNAVAGITSQRSFSDDVYLNAINFPNDLVATLNAGQINYGGTLQSEWTLASYLARINYSYDSRYILSAMIRRDGSSRFGSNHKWGSFPSVSAGWNISEEKFIKVPQFINHVKLRASYGYAGNNAIGNYTSYGLLVSRPYVFGSGTGFPVNGLNPINISNADLGWELMKQTDVGIDLGFANNRVSAIVDYFDKTTSDLLLNVPVPASTGFSNAFQNIGKVSNKGWELSISSNNLIGVFKWKTNANITWFKNKVLELGPQRDPIISTSQSFSPQTHITTIGQPMGSFYGYKVIGIYKDQADVDKSPKVEGAGGSRPGDLRFKDINADGVITPSDITIIGSNIPDFTYGFTNEFSFRNFYLNILVDGVQGVQVLNGGRRNIELATYSYSRSDVLGRWQSPQQPGDGKTPRPNINPTGGNVAFVSSFLVEDASFLRIRSISLSYSVPENFFKSSAVNKASVFFTVENAFTFTKYKGFNPEQSLNGASALTPGVDFNGYPIARIFTAGINITFQ